jgi:transposase
VRWSCGAEGRVPRRAQRRVIVFFWPILASSRLTSAATVVSAGMGAHTDSLVSRLEVVEVGRRRRWSDAEKLRIVAESMAGRRLVSATARRHGISRSQLYTWRRLAREGRLVDEGDMVEAAAPTFAPVVVAADPPRPPAPGEDRVEILLANGRRVLVSVGVDADGLARLVRALERA